MIETQTLPTLADAMSAAELSAAAIALQRRVGIKSDVYLSISAGNYLGAAPCSMNVYPLGMGAADADIQRFKGADWPTIFAAAYAWAATHKTVARDGLIRRMALAIIDLVDQHGECTTAHLRGRQFAADEIAEFSVAACARASEMSANSPFEVVL